MITSPTTTKPPARIRPPVRDVLSPDNMKRARTLRAVRDLTPANLNFPPRVVRRGKLTVFITLDDLVTVIDTLSGKAGAS